MRQDRESRRDEEAPGRPRAGDFAAWPLAAVLAATAGCSSSESPVGAGDDDVAPTLTSTNPAHDATGVAVITASFSEAMDPSTITTDTFAVSGPGGAVAGRVLYSTSTDVATFLPARALGTAAAYSARVTTGVTDVAGNALASDHAWSFTTSTTYGGPRLPALGAAGTFAILAGAIHAGDPAFAAGMTDLAAAYDDVAGRTVGAVTVAGDLGGLTLPPGLYTSTSSLSISSGDLWLDARGDLEAVFIFQVASTLDTASGRAVALSGGAKASNVFWQVATSATLGAASVVKGTILANQSITLGAGAVLNGRALARTGGVTLVGNSVVRLAP